MSLILKGIDLPKDGEWLSVIIKPTKEVIVDTIRYGDYALLNTEYGSAIQIHTPHGRLGDLDRFIESNECCGWIEDMTVETFNKLTPTILEAEEADENQI